MVDDCRPPPRLARRQRCRQAKRRIHITRQPSKESAAVSQSVQPSRRSSDISSIVCHRVHALICAGVAENDSATVAMDKPIARKTFTSTPRSNLGEAGSHACD